MTSESNKIYNEIMDTINESEDYADDIDTITKLVGKLHQIASAEGWVGEESKEIYNKIMALYHAGDEDWEKDLTPIIKLVVKLRQNASAGEDAMDILDNYRRCMDELDADTLIKGVWDGEDWKDEGTIDCIVNYVKHLEKNQSSSRWTTHHSSLIKSYHAQKQEIAKLREQIDPENHSEVMDDYIENYLSEEGIDIPLTELVSNYQKLIVVNQRLCATAEQQQKRIANLTWEDDGGQSCCSCMELRSMFEEIDGDTLTELKKEIEELTEENAELKEWVGEGIKKENAKLKKKFEE